MQNPLPVQLPQYQLQLPTPAANQLALPQHQMQKEIRLDVRSNHVEGDDKDYRAGAGILLAGDRAISC